MSSDSRSWLTVSFVGIIIFVLILVVAVILKWDSGQTLAYAVIGYLLAFFFYYNQNRPLTKNLLKRYREDTVDCTRRLAQEKLEQDQSLGRKNKITLNIKELPRGVNQVLATVQTSPELTLPPGTNIESVFDKSLGTLLILGDSGSGKTTTLNQLALVLVERAENNDSKRIPVILDLSSWDIKYKTLADWLVDELVKNQSYRVLKKVAQEWIEQDELLLMLDSLDQVKSEYQEKCVKCVSDYRRMHGQVKIIICSRTDTYPSRTRLDLDKVIMLQPLTTSQIDFYLASTADTDIELRAMRATLQHDTTLQGLVSSPLMLYFMTESYRGISREQLTRLDSLEARRKYLLKTFIREIFKDHSNDEFSKNESIYWLTYLAQKMSQHGQSVLFIERIQPTWLDTDVLRRSYTIFLLLIGVLGSWLLSLLYAGLFFGFIYSMNWESSARVVLPDLSSSWTDEMLSWTSSVFWPLIVGLIFYLNRNREIKLTVIELSRKKNTRKPIFFPLLVGLLGGLLFGGMRWFLIKPSPDIFGLIYWSGMGFMWTSLGGLMDLLEFGEKDLSNIPNQGIWQLMKKPIFSGLLLTLFWGSFFGMQYLPDPKSVLIAVLAFGFTFGLLGGLAGGGFACIRHFALRFTLHYHNQIPWNLSGFLNSNVNRIILPKIGGGYKFFHPLLQEFFVEIDERELRSQF